MKSLCIITARGGSTRIPRKNIREFCGKPIIAYSIQAALDSGLFDEVMVSTDDQEIADIAISYGAKVPFMRSEATSTSFATTKAVLVEVINEYKKRGMEFDLMCCLYPCAPFVTPEKLKRGKAKLLEGTADVVSVMLPFSYPPQQGFVLRDGAAAPLHPELMMLRTQDLETVYQDAGQFYFYRMSTFSEDNKERWEMIEVPGTEAQDIDNIEDWEIAEIKYQHMTKKMQE